MSSSSADALLTAACENLLEGLGELGVARLPAGLAVDVAPPAAEAAPAPPPAEPSPPAAPTPEPPAPAASLEELAQRVAACRACELCQGRNQVVPGEGAPQARILFVGEAPGADEDRSGRPFVGRAGQLLTRIIEDGIGLPRGEVYIANILKCRPPGNRDPLPAEKAACTPFLEEQIRLLQPELLVALGRHAAGHLLATDASLSRLRGRLHQRPAGGPPVLVTYHPAYLLRTPAAKRDCWLDIQLGMRHLGIPLPGDES